MPQQGGSIEFIYPALCLEVDYEQRQLQDHRSRVSWTSWRNKSASFQHLGSPSKKSEGRMWEDSPVYSDKLIPPTTTPIDNKMTTSGVAVSL